MVAHKVVSADSGPASNSRDALGGALQRHGPLVLLTALGSIMVALALWPLNALAKTDSDIIARLSRIEDAQGEVGERSAALHATLSAISGELSSLREEVKDLAKTQSRIFGGRQRSELQLGPSELVYEHAQGQHP